MAKFYSRDKFDSRGRNAGDLLDHWYFLNSMNDTKTVEYYRRNKSALLKLIQTVMENELTDKQREVVTLVKIEGVKGKDAAKILGVNPSTVSRHLHSAQRRFNTAYKHYETVRSEFI